MEKEKSLSKGYQSGSVSVIILDNLNKRSRTKQLLFYNYFTVLAYSCVEIASDHLHPVRTDEVNEFIPSFFLWSPYQRYYVPRMLFACPTLMDGEIHQMNKFLELQHLEAYPTSLHETDDVEGIFLNTNFISARCKMILMER